MPPGFVPAGGDLECHWQRTAIVAHHKRGSTQKAPALAKEGFAVGPEAYPSPILEIEGPRERGSFQILPPGSVSVSPPASHPPCVQGHFDNA